ncbi:MAG: CPXCG motif-containing cysteine-rich protein [Rhodopirellula sp. JB044]|uniref:CPXCG motif-containing cysteine-rich protein n=1 Tax=Rhodopirellula sp. JB044 TaxID=3342844 RepID=UPI003709E39F
MTNWEENRRDGVRGVGGDAGDYGRDERDGSENGHFTHVDDDATYVCDNCGEEIVIPVDLAGGQDQTYVEDCPVCCSPSVIHVHLDDDRAVVHAEPEQDRY